MNAPDIIASLVVSAFLFCVGLTVMTTRKNLIMMLLGLELMLNAVNLNLVAFGANSQNLDGQLFSLFVMVIAVCEAAVGIALALRVYHYYGSSQPDDIHSLKEKS